MNSNDYPLVSVHILTYNSAIFIEETLHSVLSQDYPNFEIVISDDASTDKTPEILKKYQMTHPQGIVTILNKINEGISKNGNIALQSCKGKYIAFMGGDDLMLPGKLSAQIKLMEHHPDCIICHHDVDAFDHETGKTLWYKRNKYLTQNLSLKKMLSKGNQLIGCEVMVRKDSIPEQGFCTQFPWVCDFILYFEILAKNSDKKIYYINKVLSKYRIHNSSVTGRSDLQKRRLFLFDSLNFFNWILLYYPEYAHSAAFLYAKTIRGQVAKLPNNSYPKMQLLSLKIRFNYQAIMGLLAYILSFGYVKL